MNQLSPLFLFVNFEFFPSHSDRHQNVHLHVNNDDSMIVVAHFPAFTEKRIARAITDVCLNRKWNYFYATVE